MVISYRHRLIFIHCRKTGGSAITLYLNQFLGPRDIQIGGVLDGIARGRWPNRKFYLDALRGLNRRHVISIALCKRDPWTVLDAAQKASFRSVLGDKPAHPTALMIQAFDPRAWREHFKFCFVRNPYERVVSDYLWRKEQTGSDASFSRFLCLMRARDFSERIVPRAYDNWPMYTLDDRIAVNFVGRHERLTSDLEAICSEVRLPFNKADVPVAKQSALRYDYRDFYTDGDRRVVEEIFGREIEQFNYQY